MYYRIYLVGPDDRFQAAEHFSAEDDLEAEEIAHAFYQRRSESFRGVELWQASRLVVRRIHDQKWPIIDIRKLLDKRQESIAQLEEALERSFQCVRDSLQVIQDSDKIRSR